MSKSVKCPSCRMRGKANGEDYARVATHRGRPVVQCFWCDSQVFLPRFRRPYLIEVEPMYEAVFNFQRAVDYDSMMSLMELDGEYAARESVKVIVEDRPPAETDLSAEVATDDYESWVLDTPEDVSGADQGPALQLVHQVSDEDLDDSEDEEHRLGRWFDGDPAKESRDLEHGEAPEHGAEVADELAAAVSDAPEADQPPAAAPSIPEPEPLRPAAFQDLDRRDPEPYSVDPGVQNLLQLANQVGWVHPVNRRYQPEFMNIQLPPIRPMTERQAMWHEVRMMIKYFQINGGGKEQKRRETEARRARMAQARQLRKQQRRLRLDLRKFEAGEAI